MLELKDGCFYLNGYLAIWPSEFSLSKTETSADISGGGIRLGAGDRISVGGGLYESDHELPESAQAATDVPCHGPYLWVSEVNSRGG
jgi:hypothetical protein